MTTQHAKSNAREGDGVAGLPAKWREQVRSVFGSGPSGQALLSCADELEAAMQAQQGAEPANPPGDQRQEGECNCHEGNGARNCLIHTQADFDAQQSPPPEAAAAVGEGPHEELCEELLALAEWEFNAECCNSTFPINMLRRVCEEAAAALVAPTGPQPAGGGVGNRPSPQALHEAFYERTLPGLSPREFAVMVKIEDRAHAIDKGDSHAG